MSLWEKSTASRPGRGISMGEDVPQRQSVVKYDPEEAGLLRGDLNFGDEIGHAVGRQIREHYPRGLWGADTYGSLFCLTATKMNPKPTTSMTTARQSSLAAPDASMEVTRSCNWSPGKVAVVAGVRDGHSAASSLRASERVDSSRRRLGLCPDRRAWAPLPLASARRCLRPPPSRT